MKFIMLSAAIWAIIMTLSVTVSLASQGRVMAPNANLLTGIFALGAFLAFAPARLLLNYVPARWQQTQRFAAAFIVLCGATVGITALLFSYQFQIYYAQWHDDHLSRRLIFETVFTVFSACYQFLVLALRNYFPIGLIGLILASWLFAKRKI